MVEVGPRPPPSSWHPTDTPLGSLAFGAKAGQTWWPDFSPRILEISDNNNKGPAAILCSHMNPPKFVILIAFVVLALYSYQYLDTQNLASYLLIIQDDPYGSLPLFLLFYTLSVVLLFPCMLMQIISGAVYGFWNGLLVSWVATSTGQSLAFLIGRYLFRASVKSYLHSNWPNFAAIDAAIRKEGWKLVALLRLSPVLPYNVLNYAMAITPVSFWCFSWASATSTVPWTLLYVYLGTFSNSVLDLAHGKINYTSPGSNMQLLSSCLSAVFLVVTTVYGYILSKRAINHVLRDAAEQLEHEKETLQQLVANGNSGDIETSRLEGGPHLQ